VIRRAAWLKVVVFALAGVAISIAGTADALERLPSVLHLHADLSTGDFALEQLTAMAEKQGIGALLLTENYLLRVEYGLPPFRALTRGFRDERSVLDLGIDRYLERVAQARAANPRVLIVPGVEVLPHYYWTGSPLALDMAVHETQKNMLLFGLDEAGCARCRSPVTGSAGSAGRRCSTRYRPFSSSPASICSCASGADFAGSAVWWSWSRSADGPPARSSAASRCWRSCADGRSPRIRTRRTAISGSPRIKISSITSTGWVASPCGRFPRRAMRASSGWTGQGLLVHAAVPRRSPEDGAVHGLRRRVRGHARRAARGSWDRLLGEFAAGDQSRPRWAVGESGFHGFTAGKTLGKIRTVFLVEERTERAMPDALKRGRFYAVEQDRGGAGADGILGPRRELRRDLGRSRARPRRSRSRSRSPWRRPRARRRLATCA
jgi:hypothetical protein